MGNALMALAPGHRLGQIIGDELEASVAPVLQEFAQSHGLFLDTKGDRPARTGKKVTWTDSAGNSHDLDFVLERGGTPHQTGRPVAFIETAWRRYTKHSRAKAQEIQGAVVPLLETYSGDHPFAGAVVAGEWTKGALDQLRSLHFAVLHIPYSEIVDAFAQVGIDVASGEDTPDEALQAEVDKYDGMSPEQRNLIPAALRACAPGAYERFKEELTASVGRAISMVAILPLHGQRGDYTSIAEAIAAVKAYDTTQQATYAFERFEVVVRYSNGDRIDGQFNDVASAVEFLERFAPN